MVDFRAKLHEIMLKTLEDQAMYHSWHYSQDRPRYMPLRPWRKAQSVYGDCSKGVQFLCWWVYLPAGLDPMGNDYGPYGNSQTLWVHLRHVASAKELEVGDIITFGYNGDEHATMVLEEDPIHGNPLLWSHGHQGAPNTYRLSEDQREHQYLKLGVPDDVSPPTPEDKLRAKTGWFMWVAWKQGEGAWKKYGKANRKVRPNVPTIIPLSWWKRYAQFLLNRKKGNKPKGK